MTHLTRLRLEVVKATESSAGAKFPMAVKLTSDDFRKVGFTLEKFVRVVSWFMPRRLAKSAPYVWRRVREQMNA
ncbi:hypothetical protein [Marinobacter confluentis]|uniref:Uncharacterized protein n=1 Tax=Marinobacter confluentis TaxID=1697557 RepID=A0A4Z1BET7_9GAMM|nr:hypothetical protein [Marinobacter confluentis]TGN41184.1 hypothetical protein E5Q11_01125 [Marinobacter confluentis]